MSKRIKLKFPVSATIVRSYCLIFLLGFLYSSFIPLVRGNDVLPSLIKRALRENPRLAESRARAAQARDQYKEKYGFFDPGLYVAAGASDTVRSVAAMGNVGSMSSEAFEVQAGLQVPVRPGFYFHLAAAERHRHRRLPEGGRHESLVGAGVRVPLMRDRGFNLWDLQRRQRLAEWDKAMNEYLEERQRLRHQVEKVYIDLCENILYHEIARGATERLQILLEQTEKLVEYKEIAEYQIFTARMEVDLSRTDQLAAEQRVEVLLLRLTELLAGYRWQDADVDREQWLKLTEALTLPENIDKAYPYRNRGDYLKIENQRLQAELQRQEGEEQLRGELSLQAAATLRHAADEPFFSGSDDGDRTGGHVMLVYERSLGFKQERSRLSQYEHRVAELEAGLQSLILKLEHDFNGSKTRFDYASARFAESQRAVDSARRSMQAENERFRLGEARSRDVLDAQNDVTRTERQQVAVAADLWRAWSDFRFAVGYLEEKLDHFDCGGINNQD